MASRICGSLMLLLSMIALMSTGVSTQTGKYTTIIVNYYADFMFVPIAPHSTLVRYPQHVTRRSKWPRIGSPLYVCISSRRVLMTCVTQIHKEICTCAWEFTCIRQPLDDWMGDLASMVWFLYVLRGGDILNWISRRAEYKFVGWSRLPIRLYPYWTFWSD